MLIFLVFSDYLCTFSASLPPKVSRLYTVSFSTERLCFARKYLHKYLLSDKIFVEFVDFQKSRKTKLF